MFDTINFKITRGEVEGVDFLSEITPYLNPVGLSFHDFNGTQVVTGKTGNISVSISPDQVRIKDGSLCKWYLGDNYKSMGRADTQRAVERLSDTLHLPMNRAIVTRIDVGMSIIVKQPPTNYFNHLGLLKYATRLQQPNSLYYHRHQQSERLCFYDKNREQRDHREAIPDLYKSCNVLRYEQRYMARLPRLLKVQEVTGAMLYDEAFYTTLLNRWRDTYREIRKINEITLNFQAMKNKQQFYKMGILSMVERVGGEVEMIEQISEAQKRGDITRKQAYDLKQVVKAACKVEDGLTIPNEAITELDKKIAEAIRYYR